MHALFRHLLIIGVDFRLLLLPTTLSLLKEAVDTLTRFGTLFLLMDERIQGMVFVLTIVLNMPVMSSLG